MSFKVYLLNESRSYLGQKFGDILSALQSLLEDAPNLGNRQLYRAAQGIVNQIRRILKDQWPDSERSTLNILQKVAVALMRAIDQNEDMRQILTAATEVMTKGAKELEVPINNVGSPEADAKEAE